MPPSSVSEEEQRSVHQKKRNKGIRQQRTHLPAVMEEETSNENRDIMNESDAVTNKKSVKGIKGFIKTCYRKVSPLQRKGYNKLAKDKY